MKARNILIGAVTAVAVLAAVATGAYYAGLFEYLPGWAQPKALLRTLTHLGGRSNDGLIAVKVGEKWGFIDTHGNYVANPQFDEVRIAQEAPVYEGFALDDHYGMIPVRSGDKWGYIGPDGRYAINPQFAFAGPFDDDTRLAVVGDGTKFGLIDNEGKYVVNPQFDDLSIVSGEGLYLASSNGKWGYIDRTGTFVIAAQFETAYCFDAATGLALVKSEGKWGYIDKTGKYAINPQFDQATAFDSSGGLAAVIANGKVGYIDPSGHYVINPQFDTGIFFGERLVFLKFDPNTGLAMAARGDKFGFIDRTGTFVVQPQFVRALPFMGHTGLAVVNIDGKIALVDRSGKIVVKTQNDLALWMQDRVFAGKNGTKFTLFDDSGRTIITPAANDYEPCAHHQLIIISENGKMGLIDERGDHKVNPQFDKVYCPVTLRPTIEP